MKFPNIVFLTLATLYGCGSANQPVNRQPTSLLDKMLADCAKSYDQYQMPVPRGSLCNLRFEILDGDRNNGQRFNANGSGKICQNNNIFVPSGPITVKTNSRTVTGYNSPPLLSTKIGLFQNGMALVSCFILGNSTSNCLQSSEILTLEGPKNTDYNTKMYVKNDPRAPGIDASQCLIYRINFDAQRDILYEGCAMTQGIGNTYCPTGAIIIKLRAYAQKKNGVLMTEPCGECTNPASF